MGHNSSQQDHVDAMADEKGPAVEQQEVLSVAEEKALLRRIDLWICPMMALSMALQYLDKQALPAASILGIIQDLHLSGMQYSWAASIFSFGYMTLTGVVAYFIVRLPIGKFLVGTFFAWAIATGCAAAVRNFGGLMAVRFVLGAAEAAAIPCFSIMTGMFYKREEHPLRHGYWFLGTSLGIMLAGLLSFSVAHIKSGNGPWKWLFVALGVISALWGVLMFFWLPDTPANAKFLTPNQRIQAVERVKITNQTVVKSNVFRMDHFFEAITDIKVLLVVLFLVAITICNSSITAFSQIVLVGLGFNVYQANLLTIATGGMHGLFGITACYICTRYRNVRAITCIILCAISMMGSLLVRFGPNLGSKLFGFLVFFAYPCVVSIALSIIQSNVGGFTKKSVATAMATFGYSAGNIVGPFLFPASEKPKYPTGFTATSCCFGAAIILMGLLIVAVRIENARRDKRYGQPDHGDDAAAAEEAVANDLSDGKNTRYRYVY